LPSNQGQRSKTPVKVWRQGSEAAAIIVCSRRVRPFKVSPTLVSSTRHRRNGDQLGRADDIDPPVLPVLDPQYLLACDKPMLDDPVERATDQLSGAFRSHARNDSNFALYGSSGNSSLQHFQVAARERDLG
jgi:hypothetical protein